MANQNQYNNKTGRDPVNKGMSAMSPLVGPMGGRDHPPRNRSYAPPN